MDDGVRIGQTDVLAADGWEPAYWADDVAAFEKL
jgi:hypothetical protein